MKPKLNVYTRTVGGLVEVPAFHIWHERVEGCNIALGLHHAPENHNKLVISELSTGFCVDAIILMPKRHQHMTVSDALAMPGKMVRRQARNAIHHLLKKRGSLEFIRSIANAQIKVAKLGEQLNNDHALITPGAKDADSSPSKSSL